MSRKVINVDWIGGTVGIVSTVDTDTGERQAYVKNVDGFNEEVDIQNVLNHGSKMQPHVAERLHNHLSTTGEKL